MEAEHICCAGIAADNVNSDTSPGERTPPGGGSVALSTASTTHSMVYDACSSLAAVAAFAAVAPPGINDLAIIWETATDLPLRGGEIW